MATGGKSIDPRFDPAFQRGYSQGDHAHSDAVRAAGTVDALRADADNAQYSRAQAVQQPHPKPEIALAAPAIITAPPAAATTDTGSTWHEQQPDSAPAPRSHYLDDAGAIAETAPADYRKSFARNPWIYVLWIVGAVAALIGSAGQIVVYGMFYGPTQGPIDLYWVFPATQSVGPMVTNLGVFCLTAALLVHALNWMRKNS